MEEFWTERYELVVERMRQMQEEQMLPRDWQEYFATEAEYAEQACDYLAFVQDGGLKKASLEALLEWNSLFNRPWKSPQGECAPLMDLLSEELRSLGLLAAQERSEEFLIRLELFVEIYGICVRDWQEEKKLPEQKSLRECLYWYLHDYADTAPLQELQYMEASEENPVCQLLQEADLDEEKYLYRYGIPVTDRELALWEWANRLALGEVEFWAGKLAEEIVKMKTNIINEVKMNMTKMKEEIKVMNVYLHQSHQKEVIEIFKSGALATEKAARTGHGSYCKSYRQRRAFESF